MSGRRDGYKVSGVLASRQAASMPAETEFPTTPSGPVTLPIPTTPAPQQASMPSTPKLTPTHTDEPERPKWELVDDGEVVEIPTDLIDDSPFQPEEDEGVRYSPESITELAQTIASEGQHDPALLRRRGKRFEAIAGHRRVRACRMLKRPVRAIIVTMDDAQAERAVMVHNEGRRDNSDYKRAKLYLRAKDQGYAKRQEDIALMFGTKQELVSRRLKMLKLPASILALLDTNPDLFGLTTAETLFKLLEEFPGKEAIITSAVARLSEPGVKESSIRAWVSQMVAADAAKLAGLPVPETEEHDAKPRVFTDRSKRPVFTSTRRGRVITVRVSDAVTDLSTVMRKMSEFLQTTTDEISPTEESDASTP